MTIVGWYRLMSRGRRFDPMALLPRIHAFEFEDQEWIPSVWRALITGALEFAIRRLGYYDEILPILRDLYERHGSTHVVDLCSGAGGPWPRLLEQGRQVGWTPQVLLTDRFPDSHPEPSVPLRIHPEPYDVLALPERNDGELNTMFTALHHFRPAQARSLLAQFPRRRAPVLVAEFTRRGLYGIARGMAGITAPAVLAPFLRLGPAALFWTYVVPVAPVVVAWDGVVSSLRTYTRAELDGLCAGLGRDYRWTSGELRSGVTYLHGEPV